MNFPDRLISFEPDEVAVLLVQKNHPTVYCLPFLRHSETPSIWRTKGQKRLEITSPESATITTFSTRGFTVVQRLASSPDHAEIVEEVFNFALPRTVFTRGLTAKPHGRDFLVKETADFTNAVGSHWRVETHALSLASEPISALVSAQATGMERFLFFKITTPDASSIELNHFLPSDLKINGVGLPAAYRLISANGLFPILTIGPSQFYNVQAANGCFWLTENKIASGNYSPASVDLPAGAITATWCDDDLAPLSPAAQFHRQLLLGESVNRLLALPVEMKAAFIGENQASFSPVKPEALHSETEIGECLTVRTLGSLAACDQLLFLLDGSVPPLVDPLLNKLRQLLAAQKKVAVISLSLAQKRQSQPTAVIESLVRTRPTDEATKIIKADGSRALLGKASANEFLAVVQGLAASNRDAAEIMFPQLWDSFLQATGFNPARDLPKLTTVIATDLFVPDDEVPNKWPSLFNWIGCFQTLPATRILLTNVNQYGYQNPDLDGFLTAGGQIAPARRPMVEKLMAVLVAGPDVSSVLGRGYGDYAKLVDEYWDPS